MLKSEIKIGEVKEYSAGCIDMVNGLLDEIDRLENESKVNPWIKRWLIAKYRRCINSVQKSFVKLLLDDGRTEDAINHLSVLPSFRLRIMAYALMMNSSTRAVANDTASRLNVFPNPLNDDYFTISIGKFSAESEYTIKISSLDGRELENTVISDVNSRIDINGDKGVYIVQLFENNKLVNTQKLVKL